MEPSAPDTSPPSGSIPESACSGCLRGGIADAELPCVVLIPCRCAAVPPSRPSVPLFLHPSIPLFLRSLRPPCSSIPPVLCPSGPPPICPSAEPLPREVADLTTLCPALHAAATGRPATARSFAAVRRGQCTGGRPDFSSDAGRNRAHCVRDRVFLLSLFA